MGAPRVTWKRIPATFCALEEAADAPVLEEFSMVPDTRVHPIRVCQVNTVSSADGNGDVTIWYTADKPDSGAPDLPSAETMARIRRERLEYTERNGGLMSAAAKAELAEIRIAAAKDSGAAP
jgi:hypothetical protein